MIEKQINYKKIFLVLTLVSIAFVTYAQCKTTVYLIPGQGSDYRIFNKIHFKDNYKVKHVKYFTPKENCSMKSYAKQLSKQIDTSETFIIIGVSLGGMIATEMTEFLTPEKTIIISSAKCKYELPHRYRFQNIIPIYKIVPGKLSKKSSFIVQPLFEPDRNLEKEIFIDMLKKKDPLFLERTISMIMSWSRTSFSEEIVHIHGDNDHTIPIKNIKYNYLIKDGSHMMTLTKGEEISNLINKILQ